MSPHFREEGTPRVDLFLCLLLKVIRWRNHKCVFCTRNFIFFFFSTNAQVLVVVVVPLAVAFTSLLVGTPIVSFFFLQMKKCTHIITSHLFVLLLVHCFFFIDARPVLRSGWNGKSFTTVLCLLAPGDVIYIYIFPRERQQSWTQSVEFQHIREIKKYEAVIYDDDF